jgi:hypothetical protein
MCSISLRTRVPFSASSFSNCVDLLVALLDHFRRRKIAHLHNEHVFILRTVEDVDEALLRRADVQPPEIVVRHLLFRRLAEAKDVHAQRAGVFEAFLGRAVLAGSVDALHHTSSAPALQANMASCSSLIARASSSSEALASFFESKIWSPRCYASLSAKDFAFFGSTIVASRTAFRLGWSAWALLGLN